MQKLTGSDIISAAGGRLISGDEGTVISGITTDSRKAGAGRLFIPLVGENNDGHDYIKSALENGADMVITHKTLDFSADKCIIEVKDTLIALGDIARYYKNKYNVPTVSVTGSVGKTTTKDMIYSALSAQRRTLKTQGNFNNNIGVPLTIFNLEADDELAVIEMGMNHFGEIEYLTSIVKPDVAVITNIGMSHIENLGSREGIFKAKMEITKGFTDKNTLIVNGDDDYLKTVKNAAPYKTVLYGIHNKDNDVFAKDIKDKGFAGIEFTAVADGREYPVRVNVPGEHNVYNALAAICVAREFGIDIDAAISGIADMELTSNRFEQEDVNGMTLIKDYYNASPASISSSLKILGTEKKRRKVAILGDVLEMGEYAEKAHYDLGYEVVKNGIDLLITAGDNAARLAEGARDSGMSEVYAFDTTDTAADAVNGLLKPDDVVLIKASHGMEFEKIYEKIKSAENTGAIK